MCDIMLSIPEESLLVMKATPEQLGSELRIAAAMKLYELGRLSSAPRHNSPAFPAHCFWPSSATTVSQRFARTKRSCEDVANA